jgi:predicted dehydrogenase
MVNLGLIGAGRWGRNYIRTLEALPDVRLAAVASRNPETQSLVGTDVQVLSKWETILNLGLDGLILAVPPTVQPTIALRAIEVGLPLLLEKPMALNPALACEIAEQAKARNVYVAVNHIYLHHPAYIQLKRCLVESGEPITAIRTHSGNHGPFRTNWNALWDWGPHDVAMALDLTGGPAIVEQAQIKTHNSDQPGAGNYSLNLNLPNGVHAQLKFGNLMPQRLRQLQVTTSVGKYVFDDEAENCLTFRAPEKDIVLPVPEERPLDNVLGAFANQLRPRAGSNVHLGDAVMNIDLLAQAETAVAA